MVYGFEQEMNLPINDTYRKVHRGKCAIALVLRTAARIFSSLEQVYFHHPRTFGF